MGAPGHIGFADQLLDAMKKSEEVLKGDDRIDFEVFKACSDAVEDLSTHFKKTGSWGTTLDDQFEVMEALRDIFDGQYDPALFENLDDSKKFKDGVYQWGEKGKGDSEQPDPVNSALALGILCLDPDNFIRNIENYCKTIKDVIFMGVEVEEKWFHHLSATKGVEYAETTDSFVSDGWGEDDAGTINDSRDVIVPLMKISNQAFKWLNNNDETHEVDSDDVEKYSEQLSFLSQLAETPEIRGTVEVYLLTSLDNMTCDQDIVRDGRKMVQIQDVKNTVDIGVSLLSYLRGREHDSEFELSLYSDEKKGSERLILGDYSYAPVRQFLDWRAESNPTAQLIIDCIESGYDPVRVSLYNIQCWLLSIQNEDGGWGEDANKSSDIDSTSRVLYLLGDCSRIPKDDRGDSKPFTPPDEEFILPNPLIGYKNDVGPLKNAAEYVLKKKIDGGGWKKPDGDEMDPELTARIVGGLSYAIEDHKPPLYMDDLLRICARSAVTDAFKERYAPKVNRVEFEISPSDSEFAISSRVERAGLQGLSWTSETNKDGLESRENMEDVFEKIVTLASLSPEGGKGHRGGESKSYNQNNTEFVRMTSLKMKERGMELRNYVPFFEPAWEKGQALSLVSNRNDIPWELMYNGNIESRTEQGITKAWGYLGLDMQIGRKIPTNMQITREARTQIKTRAVLNDGKLNVMLVAPCSTLNGEEECNTIERTIRKEMKRIPELPDPDFMKIYGKEATKETIIEYLRKNPVDIFHFSGHGKDDGDHTYLVCNTKDPYNDPTNEELISPRELTKALHGEHGPPSLVFLNACVAGRVNQNHKTTLITDCLQAGVPAVIAMTFPIVDDIAEQMGSHIYKSYLIERETIGEACRQARRDVHKDYDEIVLWGPLALFGDPTSLFETNTTL